MRNTVVLTALLFFASFTCFAEQIPIDENHVQIANKTILVGKNIGYYDENGNLRVSQPEFMRNDDFFQCETMALKAYLSISPENEPWPLQLKYRDKILKLRPDSLGYYNSQNYAFRKLHLIQYPDPPYQRKPQHVGFPHVFPDSRLNYLLHFDEAAAIFFISKTANLSPPQNGEDYLGVALELNLNSLNDYRMFIARGGGVVDYYNGSSLEGLNVDPENIQTTLATGDSTHSRRVIISLPEADGSYKTFFKFGDSKIYDTRPRPELEQNPVHTVKVVKKIDGQDYVLFLIPLSWLNNQAKFPIMLPVGIEKGSAPNANETFSPGNTYVIYGRYKVKSLTSLGTSEQPVSVKFIPNFVSRIMITKKGGSGVKVDNTVFTSIYDNNPHRGAVVDFDLPLFEYKSRVPQPGDYGRALDAIKGEGSYIRNSQFYYADTAITNYSPSSPDNTQEITNVLIDHCRDLGAFLMEWGTFTNNTIRRCSRGIEVASPEIGQVSNCVFAENRICGTHKLPTGASGNVWYDNFCHVEESELGLDSVSESDGLTGPFITGIYGDSYLRNDLIDKNGDPIDLSDKGFKYPDEQM